MIIKLPRKQPAIKNLNMPPHKASDKSMISIKNPNNLKDYYHYCPIIPLFYIKIKLI